MKREVAALLITAVGACSAGAASDGPSDADQLGAGSGDDATTGPGSFATSGGHAGGGGQDACEAIAATAQPKELEGADIIFVVDTSGSMVEENQFVKEHLNAFSDQIVASGVDARVIMLAMRPLPLCEMIPGFPCPGLCVDAPLGSGSCPADDNPPRYYHPHSEIGSSDALSQIVDLYPSYAPALRDNTLKIIVIVSDDDAKPPYIADAQQFLDTFTALDPQKLSGVKAHAIYCFDSSFACVTKGQAYEDLVNLTGGIHGNLAQQDFAPIFDDVAQQVIVTVGGLPCAYDVPEPPTGETFDPAEVNVVFNGQTPIYKVDGAAACHPTEGGWYYDDDAAPTQILLCHASCDLVSNDPDGTMDILFGCITEVLLPD